MFRFVLAALAAIIATGTAGAAEAAPVASPAASPSAAPLPEGWYADVHTALGSFTIKLFVDQAPQTVAHFVGFSEGTLEWVDPFTGVKQKKPLYDGLNIHKVKFMERFEAGDPTGTSRGAPPYWVPKEDGPKDFSGSYRVGMTAAAMKRISGALFFVLAVSMPELNASHNCFGEVVLGRDTVDRIVRVRTDENKVPVEPLPIIHVRIFKVGDPKPIPAPVRYHPSPPKIELRVPTETP
ncbi:MAG TPA: peptidylprolyl isomerase [Candidatus Sulfotelmatobacter sp.]|jgi:cyclophilin family peptidyl-prolyl cis-trans isomerase|nr:peptidylprolyl isomerase [Candidatus Sulfotelmatobacter sp.]